jgi:hypothetical protein
MWRREQYFMMLRFGHHALSIGLTILFLAGCGGRMGMPGAPIGVAPSNDTSPMGPSTFKTGALLDSEVLSGTYNASCTKSNLQFVAEGDAMGPVTGTFTAYGTWKVGKNEWEFQEQFRIKSHARVMRGTVLGSEVTSARGCSDFKSRMLFYFTRGEEGRMRAIIAHFHSSRVFLEQFKHGVGDSGRVRAR